MKPLGAAELLDVWERGLDMPLLQRVLILLTAACPELSPDDIAELHIGERDERLLQLREWMFGSRLVNTATCPKCAEQVEWDSEISDLCIHVPTDPITKDSLSIISGKYQIRFRLPNSADIAVVLDTDQRKDKSSELLKRCVISVERDGAEFDKRRLPKRALDNLGRQIEKLDPLADIRIKLTCPECSTQWDSLFDIASFLWSEINSWAERTLLAIHTLAGAYGWTEQEILSLNPIRRQLYLSMVSR